MNITSALCRPARARVGSLRAIACAVFAVVAGTALSAIAPATAAPDFTLHAMGGPNLRLKEQRGRVVMVNFWATWCAPCREEMPMFMRLQDAQRAKGVQFVGIAVDNVDKVRQYASDLKLNYPTLIGGFGAMELSKTLGNSVMALPFTVIVDRSGKVAHTQLGPLKEEQLQSILRQLT
jgi:peroxiredoxin